VRRARGVPYLAFAGIEAYPWVCHGVSVLIDEDRERDGEPLREAVRGLGYRLASVRQVHGTSVLAPSVVDGSPECAGEADALVTDRSGIALEIRVADCVPLFVVDPVRRAVGLGHAGWRGTVAGVGERLAAAFAERFGSRPADLAVWIGPSIGPECFEVGPDVAATFRDRFGEGVLSAPRHVDLRAALVASLARAGVDPARVAATDLCTVCRPDLFHSHRRSGGRAGRNLAFIAIRAE
jgi:YfiH family protein